MTRTTERLAGTNMVLGVWLLIAPLLLATSSAGLWNDVLVGAVIAVCGGYNYYLVTQGKAVRFGVASVTALAGLWLLFAPFVLGGITGAAFWNDLAVGALVALFGGYNAYVSTRTTTPPAGHRTA
jgi:hypothetical protein